MRIHELMAAAATALVAVGCASKEEPATQALAAAEAALAKVRTDAVQYAPAELEAADARLATLEQRLAKEEYKQVLEGVPQLNGEVSALQEVVVSRQTQIAAAANEWDRLKEEVPPMIDSIQRQVDSLTGSPLPREVTREGFAAAKASLATMKATWAEANAAFSAGNAAGSAEKGRAVEAQAVDVSARLGMSPL